MNAETFTERKNILEEFYKQRMKFNIYSIDILQTQELTFTIIRLTYFLRRISHLQGINF